MATQKLVDDEKKVCFKITRYIGEYDFELLHDIEDIEEGILEFRNLIEILRNFTLNCNVN